MVVLCVIMVLITLFLATVSIMFAKNDGSPATELFGRNLYLVKSGSFNLIKPPSVVIGEKIKPDELSAGDIVIFKKDKKHKAIGTVIETVSETFIDELTDEEIGGAVLTFKITDETKEVYSVSEENIISKATKTSHVFGVIVNFAVSPAGALVIAVIPCFLIVMWELLKPIYRKIRYGSEVPPVKKQDEVPTFIPETEIAEAAAALSGKSEKIKKEKKPKKQKHGKSEDFPPEPSERLINSAAALKAYKETLKTTEPPDFAPAAPKSPDLFTSVPAKAKPQSAPMGASVGNSLDASLNALNALKDVSRNAPKKEDPPSSVKLAETIALLNSGQAGKPAQPNQTGLPKQSGLPSQMRQSSQSDSEKTLQELSAIEKARLIQKAMEATQKLNKSEP